MLLSNFCYLEPGLGNKPDWIDVKTHLTELAVARLRPPRDRDFVWHADRLLPSFGLRLYRTGRKTWGILRRWDGARNPTFRPFGEYPELSLAEARAKARAILADPSSLKKARERTPELDPKEPKPDTFSILAKAFIAHGRSKRGRVLRPATIKEYHRALLTYAESLHNDPIRNISRAQVAAVIDTTAQSSGTTTAMRTRAALSRFWSWAIARGHVDGNIVGGTEGFDVPKRNRVLNDGELAALWSATAGRSDLNMIIRLCLWTGCRRSEAGSMKWTELSDGLWLISGERSKNHRPLALPLPQQAVEALASWPRVFGKDTLFGRGRNGFQAWSQAKRRLDIRLGYLTKDGKPVEGRQSWDLHDLRRSVQTRLIGLGISRDLRSRLLNHAMNPIDEAYDLHLYMTEKASALTLWADELARVAYASKPELVQLSQLSRKL